MTGRCWLYDGPLNPDGYGHARVDGRKVGVHRAAFQVLVGPIPAGLQLDHLCRNRDCYNPAHLEPVTNAENRRRGLVARNGFAKHGSISMYSNGCRCDECRFAIAEYKRRWRARRADDLSQSAAPSRVSKV